MKRVLLVDDEKWWLDIYEKVFSGGGFVVDRAHSSQEAIDSIDKAIPDVIVLDFMMPGGSAMVLLHELQSYDDTKKIPVVLCTSISQAKKNEEEFEKYGVHSVLDKSTLTPAKLKKIVEAACL